MMFHIFLIYILVVANVYSFPLYVSIIVDLILFVITGAFYTQKKIWKEGNSKDVFIFLTILLLYTIIVCVANQQITADTIGKPLRLLLFCCIIYVMSRKLSCYSNREIIYGIGLGFLTHLACIYIQFFLPETKMFFFGFLDTEKEQITSYSLRAFGLHSSYDASGLTLCLSIVFWGQLFKHTKNYLLFLLCFACFVACFVVSRMTMAVGTIVFVYSLLPLLKKNKVVFMFILIPLITIVSFYIMNYAERLLTQNVVEYSYGESSYDSLLGMLYLPDFWEGTIFGTGQAPSGIDPGYIKIIHTIGLLGLFLVLIFYWKTIRAIDFCKRRHPDIFHFMVMFLVLLLVYNSKLLLLYSRGLNDLFFILTFIILKKRAQLI